MTCIVSLKTENSIILGSDSIGTALNVREQYSTPKIFSKKTKNNIPLLIGFCGSYRLGDILRYEIDFPNIRKNKIKKDLVTKLLPLIRECKDEDETENKGEFLLAIYDKIFIVQNDNSILEPTNEYTALGNGVEYALGSFYSTRGLEPYDRVTTAIAAAINFSPSVGGHTLLLELKFNN